MRAFETKALWDSENHEWYEEYFIDGEQVSAEDYFEEMEFETFEDDELCDGDCDNCEGYCEEDDEEPECDCPECTVLKYTEKILDVHGCPCCIERILKEFMGTVIDHIVIED